MVSISICMIVKNEEAVLARCLNSLAGLGDEIIIVDTGSTDRTKKIAHDYTDQVFDFNWCDDFAAARNFSFSKAGGDYIYVADADEVIDGENRECFQQLKAALLPDVEVVEMAYANQMEHNTTANFELEFRPKLFRRLRPFQFVDPIHETLRTDPIVYRSNVVVQHRPTGDHGRRDLAMFGRLVDKGTHFSSRLEMMYARELMICGTIGDFRVAKPYFEHVHNDPSRPGEVLRRAACVLSRLAAMEGNGDMLLRFAAPELVGQPPAEILCALGDYYLGKDQPQTAADWFSAALAGAAPELVASAIGTQPLLGLAACYEKVGNTELAEGYRERAKHWSPESMVRSAERAED